MGEYQRPQGWRFTPGGMNVRSTPDAIAPAKYSLLQNVRFPDNQAVQTRPGYTSLFTTGNNANSVTDIRAYATLGTDDLPRFLARSSVNNIFLDSGNSVGNMNGANGAGVSMIPFRPGASPQAWMYIASVGDYKKFSAPGNNNSVTAYKVGIAEPQTECEASPVAPTFNNISNNAAGWTNAGTAGSTSDVNIVNDTVGAAVVADPVISSRQSIQVTSTSTYLIGALVSINGGGVKPVQDVIPAIGSGVTVTAIRYAAGTSGACIIVPSLIPDVDGQIAALRRGALVRLNGAETALVYNVTTGPGGTVCFETVTSGTIAAGNAIGGIPCIVVDGASAVAAQTIVSPAVASSVAVGTGTLSQALGSSPFAGFQNDDYVHMLLNVGDPTAITTVKVIFNVGNTVNYLDEVFSYSFTGASLIVTGVYNLFEVIFPVSALSNPSTNQARSLANCNGVRVAALVTGTTAFQIGSFWIGGGGQPDVGNDGVGYRYRIRGRNSLTGAKGNASPPMRYGVFPRRQSVTVNLPSTAYDGQIDVVDVFRYGGSVTSYRYLGSASAAASTFTDTFFDTSAQGGSVLETDNFEPWPSVDVPFTVASGGGNTITATGTQIVVSGPTTWPDSLVRWLPGTLIQLGSLTAYTLRARPTIITSTSYLFNIEENAGSASPTPFVAQEPKVARQPVPYTFGPSGAGDVFAVGDQLRPGTVYFSKTYAPDSAPDTYNLELSAPSEPLIGGDLIDGKALVSSSKRWWALYPAFSAPQRYTQIELSVGRPMISPYGHVSDGTRIYFWTKDGIGFTEGGGGFVSLTDDDLYPIFPHEGVAGVNVGRDGTTIYAPDYGRAAFFRLGYANQFLYADYQDSTGAQRTLVCDLRNKAWISDVYANNLTCHYGLEQQSGPVLATGTAYTKMVMGDTAGVVYKQADLTDDAGADIDGKVATFEWNGGDSRAGNLWGDAYLDCLAPATAGVSVQPVSEQTAVGSPTVVALTTQSARHFSPVSLGGDSLQQFLGLLITWTDNFSGGQTIPTTLYQWQPSFVSKPESIIDRAGDWTSAVDAGTAYYRGFILEADTFGADKTLNIEDNDTGDIVSFTINHDGQQQKSYFFPTPFAGHLVRYAGAADAVEWRYFKIAWIADPWPELLEDSSKWLSFGGPGAKFMLGATIPMDTNGELIRLKFVSSDGAEIILGAFSTTAAEKTPVAMAFTTPLVVHDLQIIPLDGPARIWVDEIKWSFDPWPELTTEASKWLDMGTPGDKYLRAMVIPMDTAGAEVSFILITLFAPPNTQLVTLGPFQTVESEKTPVAITLYNLPPLIGHAWQIIPSDPARMWYDEIKWIAEPWPEIIREATPWMDLGKPGSKYLRSAIIPMDTAGLDISLSLEVAGGDTVVLGPFNTPAGIKTPVPVAMGIPLIGSEFRLVPSGNVRIWMDEIKWEFDPWPELITEATGWLTLREGGGAMFLQGAMVPIDSEGADPGLLLLFDDGSSVAMTTTVSPQPRVKTYVPYSLATPVVSHACQIVPANPCRIWTEEIRWIGEATPELAANWITQRTSHGMTGYHYIARIEAAYSSAQAASLAISSFDGTSPAGISLPATGSVKKRVLITPTVNKGQLYAYSLTSTATFQVFFEEWTVWIGAWNRQGPLIPYKLLGGDFTDTAKI